MAEDCFQDSILRINGGDLGWYNQGELDPVFEWNAFSLKIGEISNPVRTRDGYSIIHLVETEFDGFIIEDEYQKKKKKLFDLVRNYKQQTRLLQFTDSTISTMDIEFNETVLEDLYNFLLSLGNENFEKIQNDKLISFEDEEWDVSESLNKLSNLSPDQLSRIKSISDLKQTIIGLTCRSKFLVDAVANKIYETKPFKDNLSNSNNGVCNRILSKYSENPETNGYLLNSLMIWGDASKNMATSEAGKDELNKWALELLDDRRKFINDN